MCSPFIVDTYLYNKIDSQDSDSIFCARYLISGGIILVVSSAMLNFFLSCAYSVKAIRVMVGLYVFGGHKYLIYCLAIMITMGSNIIYISYAIDQCYKNPEINITMGFGMILTIIGIIGILAMSVLLSVTLLTVEKAKIKDIVKTATLVNRATMRTLNRPAPLNCGSYSHENINEREY
ncbi:hypothetical protein HZS_8048 [Henneguya salminicola]|nr:hypothetical protein HZS_8048 [Henneguya salminicola]